MLSQVNPDRVVTATTATAVYLRDHVVGEYLATVSGGITLSYGNSVRRQWSLRNQEASRGGE
ncbi:hypothetical protein [Streptomyces yangpuensis]|uniref:hypothetical protein n=1 Tax=Streptomyces yangpuensis TaxID=1648182 RepID=UPI00365A768D